MARQEDLGALLESVDLLRSTASMATLPSSGYGLTPKALAQQRIFINFQTARGRVLF